jgi:hypothetical protein
LQNNLPLPPWSKHSRIAIPQAGNPLQPTSGLTNRG